MMTETVKRQLSNSRWDLAQQRQKWAKQEHGWEETFKQYDVSKYRARLLPYLPIIAEIQMLFRDLVKLISGAHPALATLGTLHHQHLVPLQHVLEKEKANKEDVVLLRRMASVLPGLLDDFQKQNTRIRSACRSRKEYLHRMKRQIEQSGI